jgi:hypothetical protein
MIVAFDGAAGDAEGAPYCALTVLERLIRLSLSIDDAGVYVRLLPDVFVTRLFGPAVEAPWGSAMRILELLASTLLGAEELAQFLEGDLLRVELVGVIRRMLKWPEVAREQQAAVADFAVVAFTANIALEKRRMRLSG